MQIVIYSNAEEVIATTTDLEAAVIEEYFTNGGRDIEEYDRLESTDNVVHVTSALRMRS